jgi:hypothetical protein
MPDNTAPGPGFVLDNARVHNLIQGQQVELHMHQPALPQGHSFAGGPLLVGRIPGLAAARLERETDRAIDSAGRVTLTGMSGAGKTQATAAYARRRWDAGEFDLLVWVDASTRERVRAAYAAADEQVRGVEDPEQAAEAFLTWLDRPNAPRWLIVLDGVTDPEHLAGLLPPDTSRGKTIVTTQLRSAALEDGRGVHIGQFTPEESEAFLERRLGSRSRALRGAAELAAELGHLPLALAQAAAYLLDRPGTTCRDYSRIIADGSSPGASTPATAALRLSIERADGHPPQGLASTVLWLASVLDPAGIPVAFFTSEIACSALTKITFAPVDAPISPRIVEEALAGLHRLSLLDIEDDAVRVHPLVQLAAGEGVDSAGRDAFVGIAAHALSEIWPPANADRARCAIFHANAEKLLANARSSLFTPDVHPLLTTAGSSIGNTGQMDRALGFFGLLGDKCAAELGPEHKSTLFVQEDIARWQAASGDPVAALDTCTRILETRRRTLDPDDITVLVTRNNVAHLQTKAGDIDASVASFEALIPDFARVLGPDHELTLNARSNLALARGLAGDVVRVAAEFESILADCLRFLSPDSGRTLNARANLVYFQSEASGDYVRAAADMELLLADYTRVLGPEHPETETCRAHLDNFRREAEQADRLSARPRAAVRSCRRGAVRFPPFRPRPGACASGGARPSGAARCGCGRGRGT